MGSVVLWSAFGYYIYFSLREIFSFVGIPFLNIAQYWTITASVVIVLLAYKFIIKKTEKITVRQCAIILIGFSLLIALYVIEPRINLYENALNDVRIYYTLFCMPSLLAGVLLCGKIKIGQINCLTDILCLIFFVALTIGYIRSGSGGVSLGGSSYQNYSYCSAYLISLSTYMLIYADKNQLFKFFRHNWYNTVRFLMIPISFIYMIAGGGRGAFVLCCVSMLTVFIDKILLQQKWKQMFLIILVAITAIIFITPIIENNEQLNSQFERATSFIGEDGIDMEHGSSGRDLVYENAIEYIKESPIIGYGIAGSIRNTGRYSHNLYLDILFDGGIIYFAIWVVVTVSIILRMVFLLKKDIVNMAHLQIFLCTYIMLMFSGYYCMHGGLWFYIGYLMSRHYKTI